MIDNESDALQLLSSEIAENRFIAARFFIKNPSLKAKGILVEQKRIERVRHVQLALSKALHTLDKLAMATKISETDTQVDEQTDKVRNLYLKAEAIDEFSGIILHELAPKIGMLKTNAAREILHYEGSLTKKNIDSLARIFSAIESLRKSSVKHENSELDLSQILKDIAAEENRKGINIIYEGPLHCIIKNDKSILSLIFSNAIRNSIESLELISHKDVAKEIIICWGTNKEETWVSIIDNGIGISGDINNAFKIGITNKKNHTGFGLAIISQAIETLGGELSLNNVEAGGAKIEFRWGNY